MIPLANFRTAHIRLPSAPAGQMAPCGCGAWHIHEPVSNPAQVKCGGDQDVLQVGLGQPDIARTTQVSDAHRLGKCTFDAGRAAYWSLNTALCWCRRACCSASYWACGHTVMLRGPLAERVHCCRTAQAAQACGANRMLMIGLPR